MSKLTVVTFTEYKSENYLCGDGEDIFTDTSDCLLCCENGFEKWLKCQRLFIKRYTSELEKNLNDICLPNNKWGFFILHYERQVTSQYLASTYPTDGYFESINHDNKVACLLPEPSDRSKYRVSIYYHNGPIRHENFDVRDEAISYIAKGGYKPQDGVLDELVGTDSWNRGLYICQWCYQGVHPVDAIRQNKSNPEIQRLFADAINL